MQTQECTLLHLMDILKILLSMFESSEVKLIRSMSSAIFRWQGIENHKCKVCHIHGSADKVIFPPEETASIIEGGGHLISMTHADLAA